MDIRSQLLGNMHGLQALEATESVSVLVWKLRPMQVAILARTPTMGLMGMIPPFVTKSSSLPLVQIVSVTLTAIGGRTLVIVRRDVE